MISMKKAVRKFRPASVSDQLSAEIDRHNQEMLEQDLARIAAFNPNVLEQLEQLDAAAPSDSKDVARRIADLITLLERFQPRRIFEMGAGRSSLVFAAWAEAHGVDHIAYEESEEWRDLITTIAGRLGARSSIELVTSVDVSDQGVKYASPPPEGADFCYIDGPSGQKPRRFATPDGKALYFDIAHYWEAGARPHAVVVDGRVRTVLYMSAMLAAEAYERTVSGSVVRKIMHDKTDSLHNRHTVFALKS